MNILVVDALAPNVFEHTATLSDTLTGAQIHVVIKAENIIGSVQSNSL